MTPESGVLYVSMPFNTTLHLCACGCGSETWVPIRPDRHHLTYDGEHVTIVGSIGNWRFPCRSHYWVRANQIVWADTVPSENSAPERPATARPGWRRLLDRLTTRALR